MKMKGFCLKVRLVGLGLAALFGCLGTAGAQNTLTWGWEFVVSEPGPDYGGPSLPTLRETYTLNEALMEHYLEEGMVIFLPTIGQGYVRLRVMHEMEIHPDCRPFPDFRIWPLMSDHEAGVAIRVNGQYKFQYKADGGNILNNYMEFIPSTTPGEQWLLAVDGYPDLPRNDASGGDILNQADINAGGFSFPATQPGNSVSDNSLLTSSTYSAQTWEETVRFDEARALRGAFAYSPGYKTQAESTNWLDGTPYLVEEYIGAMLGWANTSLYPMSGLYIDWMGRHAFTEAQFDAEWAIQNPGTTRTGTIDAVNRGVRVEILAELLSDYEGGLADGREFDFGHGLFTNNSSLAGGEVCGIGKSRFRSVSGPKDFRPVVRLPHAFFLHELGHALGCSHTFNYPHMNSSGSQRIPAGAREPGSGTSVMGYVTTGYTFIDDTQQAVYSSWYNVVNELKAREEFRDPMIEYFTNWAPYSLGQIQSQLEGAEFLSIISTFTCGVPFPASILSLSEPELIEGTAPVNYIPHSTPFMLAAEKQAGRLYGWNQNDAGGDRWTGLDDVACKKFAEFGPQFIRDERRENPVRYFPPLDSLLEGKPILEHYAHPTDERTFTFGLTTQASPSTYVAVGLNIWDGMKVHVEAEGPFRVFSGPGFGPNTVLAAAEQPDGSLAATEEIEWTLAGTNQAPINMSSLDIYVIVDNDMENRQLIASNVPNTGSASVTIPLQPVTLVDGLPVAPKQRLMLKSPDHIFFAVSPPFEVQIADCMVPYALNYNELATVPAPCEYEEGLVFCAHPMACNYSEDATSYDQCAYQLCTDPSALNYEPFYANMLNYVNYECGAPCAYQTAPCSGVPAIEEAGAWWALGMEGPLAYSRWERSLQVNDAVVPSQGLGDGTLQYTQLTDGFKLKLDAWASLNLYVQQARLSLTLPASSADRSFEFTVGGGIRSSDVENEIKVLAGGVQVPSAPAEGGIHFAFDLQAGDELILIMNSEANSYSTASFAEWVMTGLKWTDFCIEGCTNSTALNYDPEANVDSEACIILGSPVDDFEGADQESIPYACLEPSACNYTFAFGVHDASLCVYPGCQTELANNYDPNAGCPGPCYFDAVCEADAAQFSVDLDGRVRLLTPDDWMQLIDGIPAATEIVVPSGQLGEVGSAAIIPVPATGLNLEFLSTADGEISFGYAILPGSGPQPQVYWNGGPTSGLLSEFNASWGDDPSLLSGATPPGLIPDWGYPAWADLQQSTVPEFFSLMKGESWAGSGKVIIAATPAGSTPPTLVVTSVAMPCSCAGEPVAVGCSDPMSANYIAGFVVGDGSCTVGGCTDPEALNYNPAATVHRNECVYEGLCGEWYVESGKAYGFTGAMAAELGTLEDGVEVVGDHALYVVGPDAGVQGSALASWTVPEAGWVQFTWAYATSDGIQYDVPFVAVNGVVTNLSTGTPLDPSAVWWMDEDSLESAWHPGPGFALLEPDTWVPGFTDETTVIAYQGPAQVWVEAGDEVAWGVYSTDGQYGAGKLLVASVIWPEGCPEPQGVVPGCKEPLACNYNPMATVTDGSCEFPGDPCDDFSACTVNDVLTEDCECAGTYLDSDADGVCDAEDVCPEAQTWQYEEGPCGCVDDWDVNFNGLGDCFDTPGCMEELAVNYYAAATMATTCVFDGPCGATLTADSLGLGFTGPMGMGEWLELAASGEVAWVDGHLMLTSGNANEAAATRVSFLMPTDGQVAFSWAFATSDTFGWDDAGQTLWDWPFVSLNNGTEQVLDVVGEPAWALGDDPVTPALTFSDWPAAESWFPSGTWLAPDSVVFPRLESVPGFIGNGLNVIPFHQAEVLNVQAGDVLTLGIRTEDGYGGSGRVLFSGFMWPITCDEPTAVPGCTYAEACNYAADATDDDGSCTFPELGVDCDGNAVGEPACPGDLNGDQVVGISDLLLLLGYYGGGC